MAIGLALTAPDVAGITEFKDESAEGHRLDMKRRVPKGWIWNAGDGTYWQNDKVGNVAWGYYAGARMHYPEILARAGAQYQSFSVNGRPDDRLDQVAIMRGYQLIAIPPR